MGLKGRARQPGRADRERGELFEGKDMFSSGLYRAEFGIVVKAGLVDLEDISLGDAIHEHAAIPDLAAAASALVCCLEQINVLAL